ncbi:MAG: tRNA (guanine-N(1)-)-methyltransferase [Chlamydiae bacterium]|nr:tRNA (guanine-N(1)-)-methyltransferase [Chlamydiota bacterium]
MDIDILSLFPEAFEGPLDASMIKRARELGLVNIQTVDLREFGEGKHRRVDDRPYGGGPGMVLMASPLCDALKKVKRANSRVVHLSPQGNLLNAAKCQELAAEDHLILLCGHYEGIDERVIEREVDEEISIGDFVLTNGALPAMVVVDALARFVPGVLGHPEAASQDSFQNGIFDCPHYTRPEVFEGMRVPSVLLGGNHREIEEWRGKKALEKTQRQRPDLYSRYLQKEKS